MQNGIDVHDAEVMSIAFVAQDQTLRIGLQLDGGSQCVLIFSRATDWSLGPFQPQNVLQDIYEYGQEDLPDDLAAEIEPQYSEDVREGRSNCFVFDPSVGLGGHVIARGVSVRQVSPLPDH